VREPLSQATLKFGGVDDTAVQCVCGELHERPVTWWIEDERRSLNWFMHDGLGSRSQA
jgi:hypothetical protein